MNPKCDEFNDVDFRDSRDEIGGQVHFTIGVLGLFGHLVSPFATRKWRSFAERKATMEQLFVERLVSKIVHCKISFSDHRVLLRCPHSDCLPCNGRQTFGQVTFIKWGMLPACRIKQLLVYGKLEAYAT